MKKIIVSITGALCALASMNSDAFTLNVNNYSRPHYSSHSYRHYTPYRPHTTRVSTHTYSSYTPYTPRHSYSTTTYRRTYERPVLRSFNEVGPAYYESVHHYVPVERHRTVYVDRPCYVYRESNPGLDFFGGFLGGMIGGAIASR